MIIELDCSRMTSRKETHDYLAQQLQLPDYYGRNLDALYDLLSEYGREMTLVLRNCYALETQLGGYGTALLATLREADDNNPKITIAME